MTTNIDMITSLYSECVCVISVMVMLCLATGSTAKKAGKRRISFRPLAGNSDNEQDGSEHEEDDVETQGAAQPALSADNIDEDVGPSASAPSSGKHRHAPTLAWSARCVVFSQGSHRFATLFKGNPHRQQRDITGTGAETVVSCEGSSQS